MAHLAAVLLSTDAGILVTDRQGVVTEWNTGAEKITGFAREKIVGKTIRALAAEINMANWVEMEEKLKRCEHVEATGVVFKHKDARLIDCFAAPTPICDEQGAYAGTVVVFHDITPKKQAERALEEAVKQAVEESKAKSAFLANMSHEIRTPLNGVIGFTDLLLNPEERGTSGTGVEQLTKIKNNAYKLLDIINNILDISKIEFGRMELEKIPFDLHDVIKTCEMIVEVMAKEKGLTLRFYADPFENRLLLGDPTRLRQILLNLLSNAIKFTEQGMVSLTARITEVKGDAVTFRFRVSDTGIGISPAQMDIVFEPFTQANTDTTRKYGGSGLGLPLIKNFVEMMGGTLRVRSDLDAGATFWFSLTFDTVSGTEIGSAVPLRHIVSADEDGEYAPDVLPGQASAAIDKDAAAAIVAELEPLLLAGYAESIGYIGQILTVLSPLGKIGRALAEQVDEYEFDAAYETLLSIKTMLE